MGRSANELHRGFGFSTATYVVIASMVGTGILVSPGYMMASIGNYPVIFGLWIVGAYFEMVTKWDRETGPASWAAHRFEDAIGASVLT